MFFYEAAFIFAFLPLALLAFHLAGRYFGKNGALAAMVLATLVFLSSFGSAFFLAVLVITLFNAIVFEALLNRQVSGRVRDGLFIFGVAINILPLFILKMELLAYSLPMTLSFIAFQRLVLLIPAYKEQPEALKFRPFNISSTWSYAGVMFAFPNILIGPIVYLSEIAPQFASGRFGRVRGIDIAVGGTLLAVGLVKKLVLADPLSVLIDPVFDAATTGAVIPPIEAAVGMFSYTAFMYLDFSAYSDMALGIARMFGIRLPMNFNSPLRAASIVDFWKRWHITLTRFIASFLFTPLSLSGTRLSMEWKLKGWRARVLQSWLPFFINFQVIALWHDISWNFVLFGLLHALLYIGENEVRRTKTWKNTAMHMFPVVRHLIGIALTLTLVTISLALVRSHTPTAFAHLLSSLSGNWMLSVNPAARAINGESVIYTFIPTYAFLFLAPSIYEFLGRYRPGIISFPVPSNTLPILRRVRWRPNLFWSIVVAGLVIAAFSSLNLSKPFIYGGF